MDFETFFQSLLNLFRSGDAYITLYAAATCLLTQIVKKLFVNKINTDVLHKFDVAVILPFIFGACFAAIDTAFIDKAACFDFSVVYKWFVSAVSIGALATVMFKLCSSVSGQSLKGLMKDDVFGAFYSQLLYFGKVREQLLSKQLTLKDFVAQVKLISANAVTIYKSELSEEVKRSKLAALLNGVVDDQSLNACLDGLHRSLMILINSEEKAKKR